MINQKDYLSFVKGWLSPNTYQHAESLYNEFSDRYSQVNIFDIESVDIQGLYPFKSDQIISLKRERANIVYGGNGAGKTTSLFSFEFGLIGYASSAFELKATFSKRIINKYQVEITFKTVDNKYYSLIRSMVPTQEGHSAKLRRIIEPINENSLDQQFPAIESYREVMNQLRTLTGLYIMDLVQLIDFCTVRVPRNQYLASTINSQNGAEVRERIFSKILGHAVPAFISQQAQKFYSNNKAQITRLEQKIKILSSLRQDEILQDTKLAESRLSLEENFQALLMHIDRIKKEREEVYNEIRTFSPKTEPNSKVVDEKTTSQDIFQRQQELMELEQRNARIENIRNDEFHCDLCDSSINITQAKERLANNLCPVCGQYTEIAIIMREYQENRQKIFKLRKELENYLQDTTVKSKEGEIHTTDSEIKLEQLLKKIQAYDREIYELEDERVRLTRENSALNPGKNTEIVNDLQKQIEKAQQQMEIFDELYKATKEYLDTTTADFIDAVNERFAYFQRELFDRAKWILSPNYNILADDGQEFRDLSHGEKNLLDIAFRLAVIEVLYNRNIPVFLLIDTPEEGLDKAFYTRLQNLLKDYIIGFINAGKRPFIVITSSELEFVDNLNPKYFRVENLLLKSSNTRPFQAKQLKLTSFV